MRKIRLNKIQDVRRLLSRIINEVLGGEIEIGKANCIGQLSNIMLRAMEKGELELRIEELERLVSIDSEDTLKGDIKLK